MLSQQSGQFRIGKYLGKNFYLNSSTPKFFTYELLSDKELRYNQIIQNLITTERSSIIRTNYSYEWELQSYVKLQDGKTYIINNMRKYEDEISPQSASLMTNTCDILYYFELIGSDDYVR